MQQQNPSSRKRNRIIALTVMGVLLGALILLVYLHGNTFVSFFKEPEQLRLWIEGHGIMGQLLYVLCMIVQVVVAVIPGEPLELMAGYAFGAIPGTLLCLGAATVGSVLVFLLVRRFGMRFVELFYPAEKFENLRFLKTSPKRTILFAIIFAIPGTPKDLLCYYAGLTDMKLRDFVLISSLARLPSIITSTLGGDALGTQRYIHALIILGIVLAISGLGLLIYRHICSRNNPGST